MKPEDLEKRRAELLAKENALLSELQNTGPSDIAPTAAAAQGDAKSDESPEDSSEITAFGAASSAKLSLPIPEEPSAARRAGQVTLTAEGEPAAEKPASLNTRKPKPAVKKATAPIEEEEAVVHEEVPGSDLERIKTATSALESNLAALRKSNAALDAQMKTTRTRAAELQRELEETRDRLLIADAEVERLSGILKARTRQTMSTMGAIAPALQPAPAAPAAAPLPVKKAEPKVADDVLIGTVVADKANLRIGPSKDDSPFMQVSRGTRLTVETRTRDWYRVITPNGKRAWVASEVLAFGETAESSPSRTVRIKGYDASLDEQAVKLISNPAR